MYRNGVGTNHIALCRLIQNRNGSVFLEKVNRALLKGHQGKTDFEQVRQEVFRRPSLCLVYP